MKKNYRLKSLVAAELERMFKDKFDTENLTLSLLNLDGKKVLHWMYYDADEEHYVVFMFKGKKSYLSVLREPQKELVFLKVLELPEKFDVIFCTECDGITKVKKLKNGDIQLTKLNKLKIWLVRNF